MPPDLSRKFPLRKLGNEPFLDHHPLAMTLLDFWSWSTSDLLSNATRGVLAEFIVANAVGAKLDECRKEWNPYDLETCDNIKVEVKSAAYVQSWHQKRLSKITFNVPKTRYWSADTGQMDQEAKRQADVYVFALLAHQDKATVDPMDLDQWRFYVLPTRVLNDRSRSQQSITLPSLEKLAGPGISYSELAEAVTKAVDR